MRTAPHPDRPPRQRRCPRGVSAKLPASRHPRCDPGSRPLWCRTRLLRNVSRLSHGSNTGDLICSQDSETAARFRRSRPRGTEGPIRIDDCHRAPHPSWGLYLYVKSVLEEARHIRDNLRLLQLSSRDKPGFISLHFPTRIDEGRLSPVVRNQDKLPSHFATLVVTGAT
jgi:hypothetical protein